LTAAFILRVRRKRKRRVPLQQRWRKAIRRLRPRSLRSRQSRSCRRHRQRTVVRTNVVLRSTMAGGLLLLRVPARHRAEGILPLEMVLSLARTEAGGFLPTDMYQATLRRQVSSMAGSPAGCRQARSAPEAGATFWAAPVAGA
jgi:hypothetical protein